MRLMMVTSRFPWPLEKGDKLRLYHQIRMLAREHEVYLFALSDREPSAAEREALAPWLKGLHVEVLAGGRRALRLLWAPVSSRPFQVHWFYQRPAHRALVAWMREVQPDHVLAQLVRTAEYVKDAHGVPRTLDYMDALSAGMFRRAAVSPPPLRWLWAAEARRLRRYEARIFDYFDAHTLIAEADRPWISHPERDRIHIVPNGVDTSYFTPSPRPDGACCAFIGNMAYAPNVDAAVHLAQDILPLVKHPGATLLLAGASPSPAVRALAGPRIEVTGWLEDIRSAYARAVLFVAPLRLGTGQQNKILEAMASGVPCILSAQVRAGLHPDCLPWDPQGPDAQRGVVWVADGPQQVAEAIDLLLAHPDWREELARRGREFVCKNADWSAQTQRLTATFAGLVWPEEKAQP